MFPTYLVTYLPNHLKDLTKLKVSLLFFFKGHKSDIYYLPTYQTLGKIWQSWKLAPFLIFLKGHKSDVFYLPT
jgi:hypothetical protein